TSKLTSENSSRVAYRLDIFFIDIISFLTFGDDNAMLHKDIQHWRWQHLKNQSLFGSVYGP
ncbi:MAG: hypothetical protein NTZ95_04125, partial [Candidatus Omnitrophica bacterium]|nr:hypothetical protein [Candidatus Omnitrophota bacterium]